MKKRNLALDAAISRKKNVKIKNILLAGNLKVLPVGLVGGLDVHEGHGGSLAPAVVVIFVVTEDLHTLDSTEPEK